MIIKFKNKREVVEFLHEVHRQASPDVEVIATFPTSTQDVSTCGVRIVYGSRYIRASANARRRHGEEVITLAQFVQGLRNTF